MQGKGTECQVWGNIYAVGHILSLPMTRSERDVWWKKQTARV